MLNANGMLVDVNNYIYIYKYRPKWSPSSSPLLLILAKHFSRIAVIKYVSVACAPFVGC